MIIMEENEKIEIDLIIEAIFKKYGYDFRGYAKASIRRRITNVLIKEGFATYSDMLHSLLYDEAFFNVLLKEMTVNVTEMFRDPKVYRTIRTTVLQRLKHRNPLKVWNAGCSTGEEAYSMAIILLEEYMFPKFQIYATDIDERVLKDAKRGIFDLKKMRDFTGNFQLGGGVESFSDYFTSRYDHAKISDQLKAQIVFFNHNLVTDSIFNEIDLILCRNVLIYFGAELQERVFKLFWESLSPGGILCLGSKESLMFSAYAEKFEVLDAKHKIYIKKGGASDQ